MKKFLLLVFLFITATANAEIYQYKDKDGILHFYEKKEIQSQDNGNSQDEQPSIEAERKKAEAIRNYTPPSYNTRQNDVDSIPGMKNSDLKKACGDGCVMMGYRVGTTNYNDCVYGCTHE